MKKNKPKQPCALDDVLAVKRALQVLKDPARLNVVMELIGASTQNHTTINVTNLYGDLNVNTQKGEVNNEQFYK